VGFGNNYMLSPAALASVCNNCASTVQKWLCGSKRPSGPSLKLLDLMNRKGLDVLV
jgi:putative transcriptional regulator